MMLLVRHRGIQCERLGKDQPQSFSVPVLQHLGPATIFIIYPLQSRLWDIPGPLSRLHLRHPTKEFVHIFCVIQESRSKLQEVMNDCRVVHGNRKVLVLLLGLFVVVVVAAGGGGGLLFTLGLPNLTG